jgi:hypothetical protein
MHVILLSLGLVIGVAGVALIGFGIPAKPDDPGGTLIIAGTIAIVGSVALIGLASAIRQLRRIAEAVEARPSSYGLDSDLAESDARIPMPAVVPTAVPESRFEAKGERPPVDPKTEETHERYRSPQTERMAKPDAAETRTERRTSMPPGPQPFTRRAFHTIWPGEAEPEAGARAPTGAAETAAMTEAARSNGGSNEPASIPGKPEAVRIFKSGVIDEMAYTLYTDGSIEAELPREGTMKFASIDELRAYLAARG